MRLLVTSVELELIIEVKNGKGLLGVVRHLDGSVQD